MESKLKIWTIKLQSEKLGNNVWKPRSPKNNPKELIIIFKRKITESPSRVNIERLISIKLRIKKLTIAAITLPIAKPTWP